MASPQKTKPFFLGSPVGQQHLLLDHSNWRNSRRNGKFSATSGMTTFGFSTFVRLIGDGRFGRPIRWALPAIAFRDTPSASPICEMDKPCVHSSFSFSRRSSVQTFAVSVIHILIFPKIPPTIASVQHRKFIAVSPSELNDRIRSLVITPQ